MAYIGREPTIGNFQVCDAISVVNNQAAYTMQVGGVNVVPETANHMLVSLNGILQAPNSSYTVSGSTITFASNLVTGDVINFIHILGSVLDLGVPSDNTVSLAKLTATGTKSSSTFLRGDNTFASVTTTGRIIQMVQATDGTSLSSSSTSYVDTGLSASITPGATSSKILVLVSMGAFGADAAGSAGAAIKLLRDSTDLIVHSSMGSHPTITYIYTAGTSFSYLDSPSSTSSLTYKTQFKSGGGENFVTDNASTASITLLEVLCLLVTICVSSHRLRRRSGCVTTRQSCVIREKFLILRCRFSNSWRRTASLRPVLRRRSLSRPRKDLCWFHSVHLVSMETNLPRLSPWLPPQPPLPRTSLPLRSQRSS